MLAQMRRLCALPAAKPHQNQNEGRQEVQLLHLAHSPHPLETFEQHRVVLAVIHYFSEQYHKPITIPEMSRLLGISLLHIETAFDLYKGKTANQALLEYRLNRLCDLIGRDPSQEIGEQIRCCGLSSEISPGLDSFTETNDRFIECFGIDLIEYHQQCFLATADRLRCQLRSNSTESEELIGSAPQDNLLLTRFHSPT